MTLTLRRVVAHTKFFKPHGGAMKYHLISALLLVAAVLLETLGFGGGIVLLAAGVGCEIWFWMRVVRARASSRTTRSV